MFTCLGKLLSHLKQIVLTAFKSFFILQHTHINIKINKVIKRVNSGKDFDAEIR